MPVNVNEVFDRGGRELITLLEYCVLSVQKDVLFVFLLREYRQRPTAAAAVALYEMFCSVEAPARISAIGMLSPKDTRLTQAIAPLRDRLIARQSPSPATDDDGGESGEGATDAETPELPPPLLPPRYLFDDVARILTSGDETAIARVGRQFDPERTARENLPGGKLNAGQRQFVDYVWTPIVRPTLVSAGYWRIAAIA